MVSSETGVAKADRPLRVLSPAIPARKASHPRRPPPLSFNKGPIDSSRGPKASLPSATSISVLGLSFDAAPRQGVATPVDGTTSWCGAASVTAKPTPSSLKDFRAQEMTSSDRDSCDTAVMAPRIVTLPPSAKTIEFSDAMPDHSARSQNHLSQYTTIRNRRGSTESSSSSAAMSDDQSSQGSSQERSRDFTSPVSNFSNEGSQTHSSGKETLAMPKGFSSPHRPHYKRRSKTQPQHLVLKRVITTSVEPPENSPSGASTKRVPSTPGPPTDPLPSLPSEARSLPPGIQMQPRTSSPVVRTQPSTGNRPVPDREHARMASRSRPGSAGSIAKEAALHTILETAAGIQSAKHRLRRPSAEVTYNDARKISMGGTDDEQEIIDSDGESHLKDDDDETETETVTDAAGVMTDGEVAIVIQATLATPQRATLSTTGVRSIVKQGEGAIAAPRTLNAPLQSAESAAPATQDSQRSIGLLGDGLDAYLASVDSTLSSESRLEETSSRFTGAFSEIAVVVRQLQSEKRMLEQFIRSTTPIDGLTDGGARFMKYLADMNAKLGMSAAETEKLLHLLEQQRSVMDYMLKSHQEEIDGHLDEIDDLQDELDIVTREMDHLRTSNDQIQAELDRSRDDSLNLNHNGEKGGHEGSSAETAFADLKSEHAREISTMSTDHEREMWQLKNEHESALSELNETVQQAMDDLMASNARAVDELRNGHMQTVESLQARIAAVESEQQAALAAKVRLMDLADQKEEENAKLLVELEAMKLLRSQAQSKEAALTDAVARAERAERGRDELRGAFARRDSTSTRASDSMRRDSRHLSWTSEGPSTLSVNGRLSEGLLDDRRSSLSLSADQHSGTNHAVAVQYAHFTIQPSTPTAPLTPSEQIAHLTAQLSEQRDREIQIRSAYRHLRDDHRRLQNLYKAAALPPPALIASAATPVTTAATGTIPSDPASTLSPSFISRTLQLHNNGAGQIQSSNGTASGRSSSASHRPRPCPRPRSTLFLQGTDFPPSSSGPAVIANANTSSNSNSNSNSHDTGNGHGNGRDNENGTSGDLSNPSALGLTIGTNSTRSAGATTTMTKKYKRRSLPIASNSVSVSSGLGAGLGVGVGVGVGTSVATSSGSGERRKVGGGGGGQEGGQSQSQRYRGDWRK